MKILTLHCDYIKFQALKKALKDAPEPEEKEEVTVKGDPLVVLTSVEKGDGEKELKDMIEAVKKTASEVKTKNVVLYPYAHLSSNLASPSTAIEMLDNAETKLKKDFKVSRAPFGYYKSFELKCKGHPLSELSKTFSGVSQEKSTIKEKEEVLTDKEIAHFVHQLSHTKLDTSKLKDNDHRILGQKLDLFSFNEASPGSVFWHPAGLHIYTKLLEFARKMQDSFDHQEIATPQLFDNRLWKISGHWNHYKDNMFISNYEGRDFGVKPMNCPAAMLLFRSRSRSYRDLPLRFSEFGTVHRKELSGVLAGMFRVIRFTQDDAHIFCTPDQVESEISTILKLIEIYYKKTFGFSYSLELSTRPEKFLGTKEQWDKAESDLETALKKAKAKYTIKKGEGAFYGPKIDLHIKDSLGRSWQCGTIQLDTQMPKRFSLAYTSSNNKDETPLVIHRVIFGSMERFIGILLEHTDGKLPLWLSPRQVRVINFTDRNIKACEKLIQELKEAIPNIKIDSDLRNDTVQAKIRDAEMLKINHIIVIGDKEEENKTIAVRPRGGKPKFNIKLKDFVEEFKEELKN